MHMWKIKKIFSKLIVILCIAVVLCNKSAYATEMVKDETTGEVTAVVTQEDAGQAISNFAKNYISNYGAETSYGESSAAYSGEKVGDKYQLNETGWISFVVHNSLTLGNDSITYFIGQKKIKDETVFEYIKKPGSGKLNKEQVKAEVQLGDILFEEGGNNVAIYVGGDIIYCNNKGERPLKQTILYSEDSVDEAEKERTEFKEYSGIARIRKDALKNISPGDVTSLFNEPDDGDYGKYYGTTQGRYVGSYSHGLKWLFNKMLGFFDYLFGILAFIIRAPFVGWANIIENMINDNINKISGVTVTDRPENLNIQSIENEATVEDKLSARDAYLDKRINIEDIIYNKVPLFDTDIFDVKLEKYKESGLLEISDDSIMYKIRENIAGWYVSIRNVCVAGMLLALIYLGIRLAIATTGESKAKYKEMLTGWVTSFIILFFIHYLMILVIDINGMLINWFNIENVKLSGGMSLYDTIRTRAYSLKLSEGFPATIFYIVLVYYLIRFLFIYIKRYITINVLALLGPIVVLKGAVDKITTGKGKSKMVVSWFTDFAMNILLQSAHAIIYTIFMATAYEMAMQSISGFLVSLFYINFMFKAEEIVLKVFKFSDAKSLQEVSKPRNYFAEGYALLRGTAYYTKGAVGFGVTVTKGAGKYAGEIADSVAIDIAQKVANHQGKDVDMEEELQQKVKNIEYGALDILDDAFYNLTGDRSLRLGLHKMKKDDPKLYEATKELLKKQRQQKLQVMKRALSDGMRPVKAMAGILTGIPMLIIDPQSGITSAVSTISDLRDMSGNNVMYGYKSKKNKKRRLGRAVGNIFTVGTYGVIQDNIKQLDKDLKNVRKTNAEIDDLTRAQTLENEIKEQISRINKELETENGQPTESEISKANIIQKAIIKSSVSSVITGTNIRGAVKNYMYRNNITELKQQHVEGLIAELNLVHLEEEIGAIQGKDKYEMDKLMLEIEEFKQKIKNVADEESESTKREKEESKKENINEYKKEIKDREEKIKKHEKEIVLLKEVEKQLKNNKNLRNVILKDNIRKTVDEAIKAKEKDIEKLTAEDIIRKFNEKAEKKELEVYATKETVEGKFVDKKGKGLDRKKSIDAVLDAVLEDGNRYIDQGKAKYGEDKTRTSYKSNKGNNSKESGNQKSESPIIENPEYKELAKKYRELKTLNEKHKNRYKKEVTSFREFNNSLFKK